MDIYRTEEEQLSAIQRWWADHSKPVLAGVVFGLAGVFGWQGWQAKQARESLAASSLYAQLLAAGDSGQTAQDDGRVAQAERIIDQHGSTAYANFSALLLAGWAVERGELSVAEDRLRWVLAHTSQQSLQAIARLRLARVYVSGGRLQEALQLLAVADSEGFASLYAELRGDIHALRGEIDAARVAWKEAQQSHPEDGSVLLDMKLQDIGG